MVCRSRMPLLKKSGPRGCPASFTKGAALDASRELTSWTCFTFLSAFSITTRKCSTCGLLVNSPSTAISLLPACPVRIVCPAKATLPVFCISASMAFGGIARTTSTLPSGRSTPGIHTAFPASAWNVVLTIVSPLAIRWSRTGMAAALRLVAVLASARSPPGVEPGKREAGGSPIGTSPSGPVAG